MSGLALYELTGAYRMLADMEDAGAFEAALAELQGSIEEKAENIARLVRSLESEAAAYEGEWKRLKAAQDARLNRADRLKSYLKDALASAGLDRLKAGLFTVAVQPNGGKPAVTVRDGIILPPEFTKIIPSQAVPDREALLAAYERGDALPEGVEVTRGTHLRVR